MGARNYSPPAVGNLLLYPGYGPMARRLAVQLFWMMRKEWDYEQLKMFGSHAGQPGNRHGVQSNTE